MFYGLFFLKADLPSFVTVEYLRKMEEKLPWKDFTATLCKSGCKTWKHFWKAFNGEENSYMNMGIKSVWCSVCLCPLTDSHVNQEKGQQEYCGDLGDLDQGLDQCWAFHSWDDLGKELNWNREEWEVGWDVFWTTWNKRESKVAAKRCGTTSEQRARM